jgi:hypothetical protein
MNNWVGGVAVPEAALQLLGQGGIANRGIAQAGRIGKVQMEHVWVSAGELLRPLTAYSQPLLGVQATHLFLDLVQPAVLILNPRL